MDFEKQVRSGKRTALKAADKDHVLVTFQANRQLRDDATRKTANLSDYLRRCLEKLADSGIDKKLNKMYDELIDEVIDDIS
jgi:hypothetical protein